MFFKFNRLLLTALGVSVAVHLALIFWEWHGLKSLDAGAWHGEKISGRLMVNSPLRQFSGDQKQREALADVSKPPSNDASSSHEQLSAMAQTFPRDIQPRRSSWRHRGAVVHAEMSNQAARNAQQNFDQALLLDYQRLAKVSDDQTRSRGGAATIAQECLGELHGNSELTISCAALLKQPH